MLAAAGPGLTAAQIRVTAIVLLQTLKGVAPIVSENEADGAASAELRDMLRLYLVQKLGAADASGLTAAPRAPIRDARSP